MPSTAPSVSARRSRKDAVLNGSRVLAAAREVFAEHGPGASVEEVARRAGLGVGTIYRRFPNKEALLMATADAFASEFDAAARAALAHGDAGVGLESFLDFVGVFNAGSRCHASALLDVWGDRSAIAATTARVNELTRRAVAAGALAPQTTSQDIRTLMVALRGVAASGGDEWRQFLHVHLRGLRAQHGP